MTFARNESASEAANILIGFAGMRMPVYLRSVFFWGGVVNGAVAIVGNCR